MVSSGASGFVGANHIPFDDTTYSSEKFHNPFPSMGGTDATSGLTGLVTGLSSSAALLPLGLLSIYNAVKRIKNSSRRSKTIKN